MDNRQIILVINNVRSAHNVGAMLRTADGFGVIRVYLCGYTPYPAQPDDSRLRHISQKTNKQISKTALGAELTVNWQHVGKALDLINDLKKTAFQIVALEQSAKSKALNEFKSHQDIALLVGSEITGLDKDLLSKSDVSLEIPMLGSKESFNVASSTAIALYHLRYKA